jgi:FtsH-binding integral membrane protein
MRKILSFLVLGTAVLLGACTTAQLTNFTNGVDNFITGVHKVDDAIAAVSQTLYAQCGQIQAVGAAVSTLPKTCSKAGLALTAINTAIDSYCQASQVTNTQTAIIASAAAYNAAKKGYSDAQTSCGS